VLGPLLATACQEPGAPCVSSTECLDDEVCAEGLCRSLCNAGSDCAADEVCDQGACVPRRSGPVADAARADTAAADAIVADLSGPDLQRPDAGAADIGAADRARPDSGQADAAILDSAAPDLRQADALVQDSNSADVPIADSSVGDVAVVTSDAASPPDSGEPLNCIDITSSSELETALANAADGTSPRCFLLSSFAPTLRHEISISNIHIEQIEGTALTFDNGSDPAGLLLLTGDNITVLGLKLLQAGIVNRAIEVRGQGNRVLGCTIDGFYSAGIFIDQAMDPIIADNIIVGGTALPADDRGGIVVRDSINAKIAGNLVVQNSGDAVQLRGSTGTFLDHNTFADNGDDGISFVSSASIDSCFRNNIIAGNASFAINARVAGNTWSLAPTCNAPLPFGTYFGNDCHSEGTTCGGLPCLSCDCLPTTTWCEFSVDPMFTATSFGLPGFYCLGSPSLIDDGHVLLLDRNGPQPGLFNGTGPEVGARETETAICP